MLLQTNRSSAKTPNHNVEMLFLGNGTAPLKTSLVRIAKCSNLHDNLLYTHALQLFLFRGTKF